MKPVNTKDLMTTLELALKGPAQNDHGAAAAQESTAVALGAITSDIEGNINFVNRESERITGWPRSTVIGQPLAGVLCQLYDLDTDAAERLVRATINQSKEHRIPRTGFDAEPQIDSLSPLQDAQGECFGAALKFNANTVSATNARLRQFASASRFVFDHLPIGMLMVDGDLSVTYRNQYADQLLEHTQALSIHNDRLHAIDDGIQRRLLEVAGRAFDGDGNQPEDPESAIIAIRDLDGAQHLVAVATPLPTEASTQPSQWVTALMLFDSSGYRSISASALRAIYALTPAEAALVQDLAQGMSVEEAAQHLAISVNTARTHLKHVFNKTGAKRQSELIHQIETGPAVLPMQFADD